MSHKQLPFSVRGMRKLNCVYLICRIECDGSRQVQCNILFPSYLIVRQTLRIFYIVLFPHITHSMVLVRHCGVIVEKVRMVVHNKPSCLQLLAFFNFLFGGPVALHMCTCSVNKIPLCSPHVYHNYRPSLLMISLTESWIHCSKWDNLWNSHFLSYFHARKRTYLYSWEDISQLLSFSLCVYVFVISLSIEQTL